LASNIQIHINNLSSTNCTKSLPVDSSGKSHILTNYVHHKLSQFTSVQDLPLDKTWSYFTVSRCLDAVHFNKCFLLQ